MSARNKTFKQYFYSRMGLPDENGCMRWLGSIMPSGYGCMGSRVSGKHQTYIAHRLSYTLFVGEITPKNQIDHLCRNRWCVAPNHLEQVSQRVNLLRGNGFAGVNHRKTHCVHGHEYTEENTIIDSSRRKCRTCTNKRRRKSDH